MKTAVILIVSRSTYFKMNNLLVAVEDEKKLRTTNAIFARLKRVPFPDSKLCKNYFSTRIMTGNLIHTTG